MIKKITGNEYNNLKILIKDTFNEFVAPEFSDEGRLEFLRFVENDNNLDSLDIFGYYIEDVLIGAIATRENFSHISLFFVGKMFQRHSFGKKLLETVVEKSNADTITIHSSPNAVNAFRYMGFKQSGEIIEENGVKYIPMEYKKKVLTKNDEDYTMSELLELENEKIKKEKEEQERLAIEHQEILKLDSQRKHQAYIEMKERKHQEYLEMKEKKHQEYLEMKEKKHLEWLAEKERRANTFEDKTLTCKKCGKEWVWTASEQKFFKEKGFFRPSMCKECRASIKTINNFHK